jgi:hypothetical protein
VQFDSDLCCVVKVRREFWNCRLWNNSSFAIYSRQFILILMSTVQEIEAAIPRLSRSEVEEVRAWIDDFLEDQLELTDEVKAKLDQSRREIAEGQYTTRQPK